MEVKTKDNWNYSRALLFALAIPEQTNDNADWRHVSDTVATLTVTPKASLAANYDYGQDKESGATVKWQRIAGYLRLQPTAWFALSPRAEYYNDRDGFTTGMAQKPKEFTLTAELKPKDGFITRKTRSSERASEGS